MNVVVGLTKLNDQTGSEVYCLELVKALRAAGHDVEVFVLYANGTMKLELEELGARLCVYPRRLALEPDRVVCMHPLPTALLLRRLDRVVPALAVVHGVIPGEAPVRASRIDRFVAVSPFVADHLVDAEGLLRDDVVVIPNGIDLSRFDAPPPARPDVVRVLWASTYIPLRGAALAALVRGVLARPDAELTVVADRLPDGLLPDDARIRVIGKGRDVVELIREHDVVAGLGEYMDGANLERLEYYRRPWGGPVAPLLDPNVVLANQNRREVAAARYDASANVASVVQELEGLTRRRRAPLRYRLTTVRRVPGLVGNFALLPWLRRRLKVAPLQPLFNR